MSLDAGQRWKGTEQTSPSSTPASTSASTTSSAPVTSSSLMNQATSAIPATPPHSIPTTPIPTTPVPSGAGYPGNVADPNSLPPVVTSPGRGQPIETGETRFRALKNLAFANSWAVSLIVHLLILIILAMFTHTIHNGRAVELEYSASENQDVVLVMDGSEESDDSDLDSEMKEMLASSPEVATSEFDSELNNFSLEASLENFEGLDTLTAHSGMGDSAKMRLPGDGDEASFFGVKASGNEFVFIVDSSTSMGGRKWRNAVAELKRSLKALHEDQKFYVVFFDAKTHLMFQGTANRFRTSKKLTMLAPTSRNLARMNRWMDRHSLGPSTMPRVSFDYGLSLDPDAIFFLTDGEFNDGTFEFLMEYSNENQVVPTINTVAFGSSAATRTLKRIAQRFRGEYRQVK